MKEHLPQPVEAARHAWMGRAERPLLNPQRQTVKPLCPFEVAQKLFGRSEVVHRLRCERVGGSQPTLPDAKSLAQERSGVGVIALGVQQSGKAMPALGYGQATVSMQCSSDGESLTGTRPGPDEVLAVPEQLGQVLEALRRGVMLFPKERSPLGERTAQQAVGFVEMALSEKCLAELVHRLCHGHMAGTKQRAALGERASKLDLRPVIEGKVGVHPAQGDPQLRADFRVLRKGGVDALRAPIEERARGAVALLRV